MLPRLDCSSLGSVSSSMPSFIDTSPVDTSTTVGITKRNRTKRNQYITVPRMNSSRMDFSMPNSCCQSTSNRGKPPSGGTTAIGCRRSGRLSSFVTVRILKRAGDPEDARPPARIRGQPRLEARLDRRTGPLDGPVHSAQESSQRFVNLASWSRKSRRSESGMNRMSGFPLRRWGSDPRKASAARFASRIVPSRPVIRKG